MNLCARCRRALRSEPVVVAGQGYGPRCAAMVGDLFTVPARKVTGSRKPRHQADARQPELFGEVRP